MRSIAAYVGAAFLEIGGCFAVWAWLRLGASAWWLVPGMLALAAFAWLLTADRGRCRGSRLRGLWRHLHCRNPGLALLGRGHAARPLGHERPGRLSRRRRDPPLRAASRSGLNAIQAWHRFLRLSHRPPPSIDRPWT